MKIQNEFKEEVELKIHDYVFPNLYNKLFECDWVKANVSFKTTHSLISFPLELFLIEDIKRILNFLDSHLDNNTLYFADSEIVMKIYMENKVKYFSIIYTKNTLNINWKIKFHFKNKTIMQTQLMKLLSDFPSRNNLN